MAAGGKPHPGDLLNRARHTLEAARVLLDGAFSADACDRAWWSAVFAARAALAVEGEEAAEPGGMLRSLRRAHPALVSPHLEDIDRLDLLKEYSDWEVDPRRIPGDGHAREAVAAAAALIRAVEAFLGERGIAAGEDRW